MGIEQFFSTITKQFNIVSTITNDSIIETEYIFMDFNSVIHNISSNIITDDDNVIIENINIFLVNFLKKFNLNKLKLLYIALDGIPTFSKILEQKKRRYVGKIIYNIFSKNNMWNKNNISPGTNFMNLLSEYLYNLRLCENIKISDSNEKGEGEMKILDFINTIDINDRIIFFSPDSDVILLSMITKNNNIKIIKQEKNLYVYSNINISLLKESIFKYCSQRIKIKLNLENLIKDIVFIFTLFGNDFMPKCESINTNLDILFLIDIYLISLIKTNEKYIINNNNINSQSIYIYFDLLKNHERRLLFRNAFINIYNNYNLLNQINFIIDLYNIKIKKPSLNGFKFGEPYYNFYNNIISFIDPLKLNIEHDKYGCLYFYLMDKNELLQIISKTDNIITTINNIININITLYDETTPYKTIKVNEYSSKYGRHARMLENITDANEREQYLVENKLDKYFKIFNPINEFFKRSIKNKELDIDYYYNTYFNNDTHIKITNNYLKGLRWVFQYYYIRKDIDSLWYYPYNKSPLFETIIKYYTSHDIETPISNNDIDILPYEQLLYIVPKCNDKELIKLFPNEYIDKIKLFIQTYPQYFLENIHNLKEGLFDCSYSYYISKCHYKLLENVININEFVNNFRKI